MCLELVDFGGLLDKQRRLDKGKVEDEVEVVTRTEAARNPYDSILFREASSANHRPLPHWPQLSQSQSSLTLTLQHSAWPCAALFNGDGSS